MATSYPPSFDGIPMFGFGYSMRTGEPEREVQTASFFGLNGIASINGGGRGRKTNVAGMLYGATLADYNAAEQYFYLYLNAGNFVLIDTQGRVWPNVRMIAFSPAEGQLKQNGITGVIIHPYSATFQHMI